MSGRFQGDDGSGYIWPDEQEVKGRQLQHEQYHQEPESNGTNPKTELGGRPTRT
ncbi:hypothetical protein EPUS_08430 [Endocarpon pusillum Z07020]|uniref:Uncharacterized protein n=1 Tax=Endocarpon pusillum (strain Z07020 / HMAS-L-300199) TaxID=1263415 RepID=U1HXH0_ENDPU|nr:uncharacterized protein EPUS_08430 [Endocarpon pusillum Z07020]ERF75525.1 hypothetical protein EPUS_08430 [Endocarpon pusillum Z07020]